MDTIVQNQKPRLKLRLKGSRKVVVIKAGVSGMTAEQIADFMRERSGSIRRYCARLGLNYATTLYALNDSAEGKNNAEGAMRVMLGLPWTPSTDTQLYRRSPLYRECVAAVRAAKKKTATQGELRADVRSKK